MDTESGPIRCDSSLSVVKIQPVGGERGEKGEKQRLLTRHKFSDPEIEELYQLHSANQKRTELFRCFLYCILFYSVVHIVVYAAWIGRNPVIFGGSDPDDSSGSLEDLHHDRYGGHGGGHPTSSGDGGHHVTTSDNLNVETPETMTLNTYASMLEGTHNRLLKSVFHVDDTSNNFHYSPISPSSKTTISTAQKKSNNNDNKIGSTTQKYMSSSSHSTSMMSSSSLSHGITDRKRGGDGGATHKTNFNKQPENEKFHKIDPISREEIESQEENSEADKYFDSDSQESSEILLDQKPLVAPPPQPQPPPSTPALYKTTKQYYHRLQYKTEKNNQRNNRRLQPENSKNPKKHLRPPSYHSFHVVKETLERNKRNIVTRGIRRVVGGGHQVVAPSNHLNDFVAQAFTARDGSEFMDEDHHYPPEPGNVYFVILLLCLLVACVFVVTFMLLPFRSCPKNHHIPVIIWSATILCSVGCNVESSVHPRLALGWILLETFLIWITIPLRMRTALFYTTSVALVYIVVMSVRERARPYLGRQIGADIILIVITNILGMLEFYLSDKKQRRAFIDTRQSLEMKLVIEEQAKEQERLLLSVLPEHLALKMRQDLGEATDGQFKKIYMSRHENVSILYADIVGFTAISSTYSASELVKILNELFATFDKLAEKYNQIRIKILGDCYYCICGAPEERADHAILCVHMGLSMVKAIKYVREKTKSSVDMRVGIHTGAILAGVLGQRQWQFDIYSEDVVLANKMESSGKPGRVHISEVTLSFLNDGFEVEPAHGEKREEILRIAGIKTYFIVRTIKPLRESSTGITENGDLPDDTVITKDFPSDLNSTFAEDSNSAIEESNVHGKQTELEAYRLRLKEELLSRDGYKDLSRQSHWLTLGFRDSIKETEFTKHKDPYAGIYYGACPCALVAVALSAFSVVSFTVIGLIVLLVGVVFLGLITTFSACETSPMKSRLKKMSSMIESICSLESELWVRRLVSVLGALVLTAANIAFMIPCLETKECSPTNPLRDGEVEEPMVLPNRGLPGQHDDCRLPVFFIPFVAVILFGITLLTYLGFWLKSLIIIIILLIHATLMLATPLKTEMECSERLIFNDEHRLIPVYCYLTLFAGVAFAGLFSLNRRLEKSARVLFLWKTEVEHQRETATQLRQKNEALVYNILPPHVATHFLGNRRRKHEELYSQSYSEVGILFASMPNFSDFYTEETVNNQGLECLRFLNEVISDYDALLELPKFNEHIIKIKTIASTYMAASGLTPSKQARPEDPVKTRWQHLSLLVEFAFELKKALTCINEQSFNHFVLKMGINHGPITAGVIGARKPHYDIWGNSVNVASRMESTGKAGCIQVTAETHRILRLYGYTFEQRGLVNVKGKGQLMTYYLIGRGPDPTEQEVQKMLSEPTDTPTDGSTNPNLLSNQQSNVTNNNNALYSSSSTNMTTTVTTTHP